MNKFQLSVLAILGVLLTPTVMAVTTVTVSGTVVIPPCEIINSDTNDNTPINVDFGDITINKIDGVEFEQDVPWKVRCDASVDIANTVFNISLSAVPTDFDAYAFKTTIDGLGIRLLLGPLPLEVNDAINSPAWLGGLPVRMKAVPVKKTGSTLVAGAFTSTASLILHYQ